MAAAAISPTSTAACENRTRAKKHRIEARDLYGKRRKFGTRMHDCHTQRAYEQDGHN
jgi:hypothetical protein